MTDDTIFFVTLSYHSSNYLKINLILKIDFDDKTKIYKQGCFFHIQIFEEIKNLILILK